MLEKAVVSCRARPSFVSVTYGALGSSARAHPRRRHPHQPRAAVPRHAPPHLRRPHARPTSPSCSTSTPPTGSRTSSPSAATRPPTAPTPAASTSTSQLVEQVRATRPASRWRRGAPRGPPPLARSGQRSSHLAAKARGADFAVTQFFFTSTTTCAWSTSSPSSAATSRSPRGDAGHQRHRAAAHGRHERQRDPPAAPGAPRAVGISPRRSARSASRWPPSSAPPSSPRTPPASTSTPSTAASVSRSTPTSAWADRPTCGA